MSIDTHTYADLRGMLVGTIEMAHNTIQAKSLLISCISSGEAGCHLTVAMELQEGISIVRVVKRVHHGSDTHGLLFLGRDGKEPSALAVIGEIEQNLQKIPAWCTSLCREPEHLGHEPDIDGWIRQTDVGF